MSLKTSIPGCKNRVVGSFVDREFFMRANGQVRFLKISASLQRRVASFAVAITGTWLVVTLGMAANQFSVSFERMALSEQQAKVESAEERVANYRASIDDVTKDLDRRQTMIENLTEQYLDEAPATETQEDKAIKKISSLGPEAAGLAKIEARQIRFAEKMTKFAEVRTRRAEAAIRQFGLNPVNLARQARSGQGGPFIPFFGSSKNSVLDPRFTRLANSLDQMSAMERALAAIPTAMPSAVMIMSSGFGYRNDPLTGAAAMHNGLDFKGPMGTAILAAADGKVTSAGVQSGYGNCIEITHANGLVTRYAHLSGFNVSLGQQVKRGLQIARMGSTGRSTGSHLHFEVRLNGQAINPRKFLEANPDVLKIQAVAGNRANNSAKKS